MQIVGLADRAARRCATSPAVRRAASRSPARCCTGPTCCCSTSRPSASTSARAKASSTSCADLVANGGPRRAVGDASDRRGHGRPISSSCCTRAACCSTGSVPDLLAKTGTHDRQRCLPQDDRHRRRRSAQHDRLTPSPQHAERHRARASAIAPGARSRARLGLRAYLACFNGIVWREVLRYLHQRERFISALVRPLIWLFIFAAGFRQTLGVSIIPPYETYVLYEDVRHAGPGRHDPAVQRHAVVAVDGLRPRDGRHAHAARQPVPALVPARLQAASAASPWRPSRPTCSSASSISGRPSSPAGATRCFWDRRPLIVALIMFNSATEKLSERFMQNALDRRRRRRRSPPSPDVIYPCSFAAAR